MSQFHCETVSHTPIDWGEAPHWDIKKQKLYYVDCFGKTIYLIDPEKNHPEQSIAIPREGIKSPMITAALPTNQDDEFLVVSGNEILKFDAISKETQQVASIDYGNCFNDGKCDVNGRLWVGTFKGEPLNVISMQRGAGSIYSLDKQFDLSQKATGFCISNGITWSADNKRMFLVDSMERVINVFNFDANLGTVGMKNISFSIAKIQQDNPFIYCRKQKSFVPIKS